MWNRIKDYIKNADHGIYLKFTISLNGLYICFQILNVMFVETNIPLPLYLLTDRLKKHQCEIFYKTFDSPFTKKYANEHDYRKRYFEIQFDWLADFSTGFEISIPLQIQDHMPRSIHLSILGFWLIISTHNAFHVLPNVDRFPTIKEAKKHYEVWYKEMIKQYNGENWSKIVDFNNKEDYAKREKAWNKATKYWESIKK